MHLNTCSQLLPTLCKRGLWVVVMVVGYLTANTANGQCPMPANSPAGTLDTCFTQTGSGLNGFVTPLALQPDGKVLLGGYFTSYNGTSRNRICRLNRDGSLDATFAQTGTGLDSIVSAIALQPDGKILVGGFFRSYNGITRNRICRLNANGTLDPSFAPAGTGLNERVSTLALQPDGKILVGGTFTSYNGNTQNRLCRLNADGSLDPTFQIGTGFGGSRLQVDALALLPDGRILVGGFFTTYNGTTQNRICRLNANGTLDPTFAPTGTGLNGDVYDLSLLPDGKVLVGGSFITYDGTTQKHICRLNSNGTLDATFAPTGTGFDSDVYCLALQPDGKVIVGGLFERYNGTNLNYLCRLNANGSLDLSFQIGAGPSYFVTTVALQPDGKVLVVGVFFNYNGTRNNYVVRLFATNTTVATKPTTPTPITLYPNPAHTHITLQTEVAVGYKMVSSTGAVVQEGVAQPGGSLSVAGLPQGVYSVVVMQGQSVVVKRFVRE